MIPQYLLRMSMVLGLAGIAMGIYMGVTQDFTLRPAHAHLNLVGFVTPFLAALYYHAVPAAARSRLAKFQASAATLGGTLFPAGLTAMFLLGDEFGPAVGVGAIAFTASMVSFAIIVFSYGLPARDAA